MHVWNSQVLYCILFNRRVPCTLCEPYEVGRAKSTRGLAWLDRARIYKWLVMPRLLTTRHCLYVPFMLNKITKIFFKPIRRQLDKRYDYDYLVTVRNHICNQLYGDLWNGTTPTAEVPLRKSRVVAFLSGTVLYVTYLVRGCDIT